ncbi:vitellogenin 3, phosvitinless isoform X1 [Osmerus eperlanus]|uniref:vitellogenin 3, phosvitinless isoform X1 n=1 Tax=Osmerus eperlanus TaxID=29151 RepID=UPI002E0E52F7
MRGFLLSLCVALAICENYEPGLNPQKTYEYKYEGSVNIGRGMPEMAESGVKLMCTVAIIGVSDQTFLLQVSDVDFEEFNGIQGKNTFNASPKLTKRMAAELAKPFMFEYAKGQVGDIYAPAGIPDTIVNIVRGIIGFFQVTVKTTQRVYELEEAGIHGLCQSIYAIVEDVKSKDLAITQTVDINNCQEKAALYRGMALAVEDKMSKERGDSIFSTVRYIYNIKSTTDGGLITNANALERQHFSPFNVKGGNSKLQAIKELVLLGVKDTGVAPSVVPMQNRGSLVYKFVNELAQIPILMKNLDKPIPKIVEMIKRLAKANIYQIDNLTSEDVVEVYQLLRVITLENMEELWKQFSGNDEHRRWFLDMIVEMTDAKVLKFLINRFKAGDIFANEAGQTLLVTFNHLNAEAELVETAKEFLSMSFSKSHPMLWNTIVLAYGSLVYKHCAYTTPCSVTAVQPLLDLADESLKTAKEMDMIIVLKALGNAGHPSSIKTIMRFLPGVAATPVDLPAPVLSAAVQSMRHLAIRDPHSVQDITLTLFVQRELPTEIRMLAVMILFDTKPPMSMVSTVTTFLLEETDLDVTSFTYSLMKSIATSRTPDNHFLSTACNVAVKILAPKYGRLSFRYSRAMRLDWFNDDLLIGTAMEVFMLKTASTFFPTAIMAKGKFHFIGRILQLLEFGVRTEGIKELFENIPAFKGDLSRNDLAIILNVMKNWEKLPTDKPLLSAYSRLFGQEWFYAAVKTDFLQKIIMAFNSSAGKESPVWTMMETLQKGMSWHWTKPFLMFETRYIQATTLGLPLEISKYYSSLTAITLNAKAGISPPLTDQLGPLLTSNISLETDGFVGSTKDNFVFHGINTDIFQCGTELKSKMIYSMPWRFNSKINVKSMKFEFDLPTLKKDTELFSINFNIYAVSRNIEDPSLNKMTPMMSDSIDSVEEVQSVKEPLNSSDQQKIIVKSDIYQSRSNVCAEAKLYGAALCFESEVKRAHFIDEYPLYYFLGFSHLAYTLRTVQANKLVDKIHIEISPGRDKHAAAARLSSGSSSSRHRSNEPVNAKVWDATPELVFSIKAVAMDSKDKPDGYEAVVYHTTTTLMANTEVIVSQVGEEANWKMCTDVSMDTIHGDSKMHLRWGAECQSYEMSMNAATAHLLGLNPTLKVKMHWNNVPEYMKKLGKRVEEYIPGIAFFVGFYQKHESNIKHEISASVVATSADCMDMKIKFPELTVYQRAIPLPFQVQAYTGNVTLGMH